MLALRVAQQWYRFETLAVEATTLVIEVATRGGSEAVDRAPSCDDDGKLAGNSTCAVVACAMPTARRGHVRLRMATPSIGHAPDRQPLTSLRASA